MKNSFNKLFQFDFPESVKNDKTIKIDNINIIKNAQYKKFIFQKK
jgi:hypothetical protein